MNENSKELKLNGNYRHNYNIIPSNINYGSIAETNVINDDNNTCFNKKISYSILIVGFCVLISDMSRGILFPTLWLNIQSLNGNKSDIGFAVAAFSLGRIISSPIFGTLSVWYGYRYILMLCNYIMAIGAIIYIFSTSINNIIFAQFIMGFSAGSLSVSRSYIAQSSLRIENRTIYLANLTAVQYFAFTCTPILGSILAMIGKNNNDFCSSNRLEYLFPPFAIVILSLSCTILLFTSYFLEITRDEDDILIINEEKDEESIIIEQISPSIITNITEYEENKFAIACFLLNIITKGTIGVFETLGSEYVTTTYYWSSSKTGYIFSFFGFIGVFCLLSFRLILKIFNEVDLIIYGMSLMSVACVFVIYSSNRSNFFYFSLLLMYGSGYPVSHTALLGLVSKIIKSTHPGKLMGWFGASGSLARVFFPILVGVVGMRVNDRYMFGILAFILSITVLVVMLYRQYIVRIILQ